MPQGILWLMKKAETERAVVRPVAEFDVNAVVALVHELAAYEQASDQCHLTPAQLRTALFGEEPALFGEERPCTATSPRSAAKSSRSRCGSRTSRRGTGCTASTSKTSSSGPSTGAAGCGYSRLQWWALDWNAPAIGFYSSIGAKPMDEWTVYRITGQALTALASNR